MASRPPGIQNINKHKPRSPIVVAYWIGAYTEGLIVPPKRQSTKEEEGTSLCYFFVAFR
jgi:hypothetical protein